MNLKNFALMLVGLFPAAPMLQAKVLDSAPGGFVIESSVTVKLSAAQSYRQFLKVSEWWDAGHSYFGKAENFSLAAQAGGCFCEIEGDHQVEHMRVSYVDPGHEIRLLGGLGPLQMMGVHGAMSWTFTDLDTGGSTITHRYAVSGYAKGGLDQLAEAVDGVQTGQLQSLANRIQLD